MTTRSMSPVNGWSLPPLAADVEPVRGVHIRHHFRLGDQVAVEVELHDIRFKIAGDALESESDVDPHVVLSQTIQLDAR